MKGSLKNMMKRIANRTTKLKRQSQSAILLTLALVLVACGSVTRNIDVLELRQNQYNEVEKVELTMWLYGSTGLEYLIEKYEQLNEHIHVNIINSTFEDVHNNLQTSFASGYGVPDISLIEITFIERFKEFSDYFHNLNELGRDRRGYFLDWKWKQATNKDGSFAFGFPTDIGPVAIVYQPHLFAEAGLPTERDELAKLLSTWQDFIDIGLQIKEKTGKPMIDHIRTLYRIILFQAHEQYFDQDTEQLIIETNPAVRRAWNIATRVSELGLSRNLFTWTPEWGRGIVEGEFATILSPSWLLKDIKLNAPDASGSWDITYLPEGSGNWGGSFLTLPKSGKDPQEAYDLIEWLSHPNQQLALFERVNNFPSTPGIYEEPTIRNKTDAFYNFAPVGRIFSDIAREIHPTYEGAKQHVINLVMEAALDDVEDRKMTPDEAWDNAMLTIKQELGLLNVDEHTIDVDDVEREDSE